MPSSLGMTASMNLTPELEFMTSRFSRIPTEKRRYVELLKVANELPDAPPEIQIQENKVPGCLSTVYIDCESMADGESGDTVINFTGWSDGLLTKGLLSLLIKGLNGHTVDEIEAVSPEFIALSKINQSLTPGRNNGFLNMVKVMKTKARECCSDSSSPTPGIITNFEPIDKKPMYNAIMSSLLLLKPTKLELIDNSDQHAGHAGSKGWEESGESHFSLVIVADAFDGIPLVKRHQMVYMMLGETMDKIHALQITAKTPAEV